MRITLILVLLIIVGCASKRKTECNYITDYYPNTANAEVEFYLGNYQKAYNYYQKAFENCDAIKIGFLHDTDKFAKICAELGKDDLAIDYIKKTIDKGGTLNEFQNDKVFNDIFKTERGKKLIADYDKIREKYISTLNMNLRAELQAMIEIDQRLVGQQEKRDSVFKVNDKRLVEIFDEFGYPNEQVVGNYGIDFTSADPTILLLHTDDSIRINYFIPKVKEFVKNGKCPPYTLGTMYDNLELFNKQPQTHGTFESQNGGYANMISDLSKVNANRAEIGLPSLKMTKKIDSLRRQ
ncbi:hypothetical protein LX77_03858 [Gelidibacter algens]|uniref:Tetratricopeptide repeat protein n=1 Tax=Gelidibacter algens TaxID=49280 RepID=A0A327RNN6_9FLAO|nr:tetratricopeptide repeat protein [Gelidibacter algens]RAJ17532.1 hypothetical protein LX77_03858 [Gelidibacter algens]